MEANLTGRAHATFKSMLSVARQHAWGRVDVLTENAPEVKSEIDIPALEVVEGEPQFRLFVAGARGSGKTVFLAALQNQLAVPSPKNCFYARLTSPDRASEATPALASLIVMPAQAGIQGNSQGTRGSGPPRSRGRRTQMSASYH
jgi:hypothetical protein